jgi:hypothetical protein
MKIMTFLSLATLQRTLQRTLRSNQKQAGLVRVSENEPDLESSEW